MKTILITNRKGGVGKTTTTISIASKLASKGFKTLLIDLDTQGHLQYGLGEKKDFEYGIHSILNDSKLRIRKSIHKSKIENLHFIPADINFNSSLLQVKKSLKKNLRKIENEYDICIIDTAPMSDTLLEIAIYASDNVIIPMKTEHLGLVGTLQFIKIFYSIASKMKTNFQLLGVLPTLYSKSIKEHRQTVQELEKIIGKNKVFSPIRKDTKLTNIFKDGVGYIEKVHSRGFDDYEQVVNEIALFL